MHRTRAVITACAVLALIAGFVWLGDQHPSQRERPAADASHRIDLPATPGPAIDLWAGLSAAQAHIEAERASIVQYVTAVQKDEIGRYVTALAAAEAEAARQAALAAAAAQRPTPPATHAPSASAPSVGGPCGGATNGADQFIQRESGGNPYIINGGGSAPDPYSAGRAWGCYQIMPDTWAGACGVNNRLGLPPITTYDPASQAACASRLGLSAWGG